jgi:hypothetical protein
MTFLPRQPMRPEIIDFSHAYLPVSALDRDTVADAITGTGWSVEYHEAPDNHVSLMIMPDGDDRLPTYVVSSTVQFCLQSCQGDVLWLLGTFGTLSETIASLRRAMANEAVS